MQSYRPRLQRLAGSHMLLRLALSGIFAFLLVACASTTPPAATSKPTPTSPPVTPTPAVPAGTVLYQSNWSHGLGTWQALGQWQREGTYLRGRVKGDGQLIAPYTPTVANYAITVRFQAVNVLIHGASIGIFAGKSPTSDGYFAGCVGAIVLEALPGSAMSEVLLSTAKPTSGNPTTMSMPNDYALGRGWHDYRVEVHADQIQFFDNDTSAGVLSSISDVPSRSPIGIQTGHLDIRIASFTVTAL